MFYFNLNYDLLFFTFMDENDKLPNIPTENNANLKNQGLDGH